MTPRKKMAEQPEIADWEWAASLRCRKWVPFYTPFFAIGAPGLFVMEYRDVSLKGWTQEMELTKQEKEDFHSLAFFKIFTLLQLFSW